MTVAHLKRVIELSQDYRKEIITRESYLLDLVAEISQIKLDYQAYTLAVWLIEGKQANQTGE